MVSFEGLENKYNIELSRGKRIKPFLHFRGLTCCQAWGFFFLGVRFCVFSRMEGAEEQKVLGVCRRAEHSHKKQASYSGATTSVSLGEG